jgi:hypothetical protein
VDQLAAAQERLFEEANVHGEASEWGNDYMGKESVWKECEKLEKSRRSKPRS